MAMLRTLKDLFDAFTAPDAPGATPDAHTLQLAAAVLLVEVMRADPETGPRERQSVVDALRRRFGLAQDEVERLVELAHAQAQGLYDYHRFTSTLNAHFSQEQKTAVVQAMWEVAYADDHLDAHENHLISKVAGLLHVTHGEYIAAKLRAKEAAGLG
ncbi:MAG TPA: TerB family tellurite resistance protein [Ramlibacter sp.]|nr:TerB family tellurite resistance protein [Ramlibacter sp.]